MRVTQPYRTIGAGDEPGTLFQSIRSVSVAGNGSVWVADLGGRVAVFDSSGAWSHDVGSRGEGPGEYQQPTLVEHVGDSIAVWDRRLRRLSFFSRAGEFVDSKPFPEIAAVRVAIDESLVAEVESGQSIDPAPASAVIVKLPLNGGARDTLLGPYPVPEYGWEIIDSETQTGAMVMPPVFSVRPVWALCSGNLVWAGSLGDSLVIQEIDGSYRESLALPFETKAVTAPIDEPSLSQI